jgi:hypothetical protein
MAKIKFNSSGLIRIVNRSVTTERRAIMEDVLTQAKIDVPKDTLELHDSGHIIEHGKSTTVVFDAPHALIQHEDLTMNHPNGGKAKYLEDAYNSIVPNARGRIAKRIADNLK